MSNLCPGLIPWEWLLIILLPSILGVWCAFLLGRNANVSALESELQAERHLTQTLIHDRNQMIGELNKLSKAM